MSVGTCSGCGAKSEADAFCCEYCGAVLRTPVSSQDELGALKELEAAARAAAENAGRHANSMRIFWQSAFVPQSPVGLRAASISALAAIPDVASNEDRQLKANLPEIHALIARTRTLAEALLRHSASSPTEREEAVRILEGVHIRSEAIRKAVDEWGFIAATCAWVFAAVAFILTTGHFSTKLISAALAVYFFGVPWWWRRRARPFVAPGAPRPAMLKGSEIGALLLIPMALFGLRFGPQYVANEKAAREESARLAAEHEARGVWKDFNIVGSWQYEDSPKDPAVAYNFELHNAPMRKFIGAESRLIFKADGTMLDADAGGSTYYCLRLVYPDYSVKQATYALGDFAGNRAVLAIKATLSNGARFERTVTLLYEGNNEFELIVPSEGLYFPAKGHCRFVRAN